MAEEIIRKMYLEKLDEFRDRPDLIKIITGVRRSGKSTLLAQFRNRLESAGEKAVSINLEEKRFSITTKRELNSYIAEMMATPQDYILLDEVQYVTGWEDVINTLRSNGANVYVTGSNAKILSSEFDTAIAGRYAEIHILPFSFAEFLERYPPKGEIRTEQRFDQFLVQGGMPILNLDDPAGKNRTIMEGVYDSIVNRDVVSRSKMDPATIRRMTDFMYSNVGNITTVSSLASGSGVSDSRTVDRYLDALTDSFIFYKVNTFDLIGKKIMKVKAKYYASDTGLRNTALGHTDDGAAGILENIVFLELIRRGYEVVIGSYRDYEVDFTARIDGVTEFYQVAKTLSGNATISREERPLKLLGDKETKIILTLDRDLPGEKNGIRYMNLIDFLLNEY
ncbi:MAG: ATP-binding protein [Candidatus Methanoplasma sp.]|nr:ATP-binding protein [Candidatus Methanoplasma sp.]